MGMKTCVPRHGGRRRIYGWLSMLLERRGRATAGVLFLHLVSAAAAPRVRGFLRHLR